MKILTVSDYVESLLYDRLDKSLFQGIEWILSCGDLPPEYLTFLAGAFRVPVYYVRGNHDIRYRPGYPDGCLDVDRMVTTYKGVRVLGLEGSRWYNGGPLQYTEAEMRKRVRGLRREIKRQGGLDIVITHAPPRHIHDDEDLCHRGFRIYRWLIKKFAPAYFIHGHIHAFFDQPSDRITTLEKTRVVNSYGYCILEIETGRLDGAGQQGL